MHARPWVYRAGLTSSTAPTASPPTETARSDPRRFCLSRRSSPILSAQITFSGAALAAAIAQGSLATGIPLLGAASGVAVAPAALTAQITLSGAASGTLTTTISLGADALATAIASATLFENYPATVLAKWTVSAQHRDWRVLAISRDWDVLAAELNVRTL